MADCCLTQPLPHCKSLTLTDSQGTNVFYGRSSEAAVIRSG